MCPVQSSAVARGPNFRPHNAKQAAKNISSPGKFGGCKMADFDKK
jgi:hypothetical protein